MADSAARELSPAREDGLFGGCPIYGEARGTSECGKCGGDIIKCPIYGRGEQQRRDEEAREASAAWCRES